MQNFDISIVVFNSFSEIVVNTVVVIVAVPVDQSICGRLKSPQTTKRSNFALMAR
jgi:hypothetical protein